MIGAGRTSRALKAVREGLWKTKLAFYMVHVHDILSLLKPTRAQESTLSYSDTRCMKLSELSR